MRATSVAAALLLLVAAAAAQEPASPRIVLSQETWDFGRVWYDEPPSTTVTIRNEGQADLRLLDVRAT